ncbi:MAG TPA: hypothetical protein GXZ47_05425 [Treponema sp.]|nr:hypothetical protein [Treponema sp.]
MKKILFLVIVLPLMFFTNCASAPDAPAQDTKGQPQKASTATNKQPVSKNGLSFDKMKDDDIVVRFDTVTITKQTFISTKSEIEVVVENLNKITLDRDFNRWLYYVSDEYRQNFSDRDVLDAVSASLPNKKIRLRSLQDYFNHVFVPSRQNMRVDDIQFVSPIRVYVIMEITPSSPAAIYILEKIGDGWKLVPKNQ